MSKMNDSYPGHPVQGEQIPKLATMELIRPWNVAEKVRNAGVSTLQILLPFQNVSENDVS